VSDERTKPYGWRWADGAHVEALPALRIGVRTPAMEVTLRLGRASLEPVLDGLGISNPRMPDASGDPMFVTVMIAVEDTALARRFLLGHADEVEVVAPLALRREIAERARRALALHTG
jgi:hypothetical protein